MKNEKLENVKSFSDSAINSDSEKEFTSKELQGYFDKKRKIKYAERLNKEFDLRKQGHIDKETDKKPRSILPILLAIAIGIISVIAYFYFSGKSEEPTPGVGFAYKGELYTPMDINIRGAQTDQQILYKNLGDAYDQKDFNTVIAEYEKLKVIETVYDLNIEQMAGIAYASMDNYDQAINVFNGILDTQETSFSNHSTVRYLLGLVYLLKGDNTNAIQILEVIKIGDYKYNEVQEILEGL